MSNTDTLVSLAMLKVNSDVEGRDYYDYLVPFISHVLTKFPQDVINSHDTRERLREEYGLVIPVAVVELVLKRLEKQRYLRHEHGVFRLVKKIPVGEVDRGRATAEGNLSSLINELVSFVRTKFDKQWSEGEAVTALTSYLSNFSIEFLRTFAQGTVLPDIGETSEHDLFIISSFIKSIEQTNQSVFEKLLVFVKGHMLANALICPDLQSLQQSFSNVAFYLDTPLLIQLLGLEGDAYRTAAVELLDLIRNLRGRIAVFDHTHEELYGVIQWAEDNIDNPTARGRIIGAMRQEGRTKSDLTLIRNRLDDFYTKFGIQRRRTPRHIKEFQIDELALQQAIEEEISYLNPRALEYDITSIRSIYTLRADSRPRRLEEASVVLVTPNRKLAFVAFQFGRENESTREVSSVITDYSLANVAWIKSPVRAPELPRVRVIAACYAAMQPKEEFWQKYLAEVDKLKEQGDITEADHQLLRFSIHARDELMNLTQGSEKDFSRRTITEILDRVKTDLTREKDLELERERGAHNAALDGFKKEQDATLERVSKDFDERIAAAQQDTAKLGGYVKELLEERRQQSARIAHFSNSIGVLVAWCIFIVLTLIITACVFIPVFLSGASGFGWTIIIAATFAGIVALINLITGISLLEVKRRMEQYIAAGVYKIAANILTGTGSRLKEEALTTELIPQVAESTPVKELASGNGSEESSKSED